MKANETKIHCSWKALPPSTSYQLDIVDESGSLMEKKTADKEECTFEGKGLQFNKTYSIKLGPVQKADVVLLREFLIFAEISKSYSISGMSILQRENLFSDFISLTSTLSTSSSYKSYYHF